jgi:hypothetical protein
VENRFKYYVLCQIIQLKLIRISLELKLTDNYILHKYLLFYYEALQIGSLALKHRANEIQKQRIICFVASTIV